MAFQAGERYCGTSYFGSSDDNWNLCTGSDGFRIWAADITFPTQFAVVPSVAATIKSFHILAGDPRIDVSTTVVSETGFTINIKTWGNTQIAGVGVQWFAWDNSL